MVNMVDECRNGAEAQPIARGGEYVHELEMWRRYNGHSKDWMLARLAITAATYIKWTCSREHKNALVPRPQAMKRIYILTGGIVRPEHFYNISGWAAQLAGFLRAKAKLALDREIEQEKTGSGS